MGDASKSECYLSVNLIFIAVSPRKVRITPWKSIFKNVELDYIHIFIYIHTHIYIYIQMYSIYYIYIYIY